MNFCPNVLKRKLHTVCCIYNVGFIETSFPMDFVERRISGISRKYIILKENGLSTMAKAHCSAPSIFMTIYFHARLFSGWSFFMDVYFQNSYLNHFFKVSLFPGPFGFTRPDLPCNPKQTYLGNELGRSVQGQITCVKLFVIMIIFKFKVQNSNKLMRTLNTKTLNLKCTFILATSESSLEYAKVDSPAPTFID